MDKRPSGDDNNDDDDDEGSTDNGGKTRGKNKNHANIRGRTYPRTTLPPSSIFSFVVWGFGDFRDSKIFQPPINRMRTEATGGGTFAGGGDSAHNPSRRRAVKL